MTHDEKLRLISDSGIMESVEPSPEPESAKRYCVSVSPGPDTEIDPNLGRLLTELEKKIGHPLWCLCSERLISSTLYNDFFSQKTQLTAGEEIALLIDSPGGYAKSAFKLADFLRKRCGGFTVVIPYYAKSAATLLALGADTIIMGNYAEIGPLDVQVVDPEREEMSSALNEVQALERLHEIALQEIDSAVMLLLERSKKKIDTILPLVLQFVVDMKKPLLEKLDTVHYTQMSRQLKETEDYATRLLRRKYSDQADVIADKLVRNYADHSYFIDCNEAIDKIKLDITVADDEMEDIFYELRTLLS